MTATIGMVGDREGRASIRCELCPASFTVHAYSISKTRRAAGNLGWAVQGGPGERRDYCPLHAAEPSSSWGDVFAEAAL